MRKANSSSARSPCGDVVLRGKPDKFLLSPSQHLVLLGISRRRSVKPGGLLLAKRAVGFGVVGCSQLPLLHFGCTFWAFCCSLAFFLINFCCFLASFADLRWYSATLIC